MLTPMRPLLDLVEPWLPPSLLPPAWRARIHALAAHLPPAFGWGLFECRLEPGEARVDFMVCAMASDGGRARLADLGRDEIVGARLAAPARFFSAWAREGSPVHAGIPLVWLEYDLPPDRDPDPLVSLCVDPGYPTVISWPPVAPARVRALGAEGLALVLGREPDAAALRTLERCAAKLPAAGRLLHVAMLEPRGTRALRLFASLPVARVTAWLDDVGFPRDVREVEAALGLAGDPGGMIGIHLEVADAVLPYFAAERASGCHDDDVGHGFVERLVQRGVCEPARGEAALRWVGEATASSPEGVVYVERQLYFKLVPHVDGRLEAKAYLGFHGDLRPR